MFPIAHAWLVNRLVASPSPAHFLGCVWPDMLFESPITHAQSHRSGQRLASCAAARPEDGTFRDFVAGVLTHGSEPHGLDWYSDEQYEAPAEARGYAFQKAVPLATDTAAACGLPAEQGWWKAHNLVEMAFELRLFAERPALGDALVCACTDEALITRVATVLAGIFDQPADQLAHAMRSFVSIVDLQPASVEALADIYARQVRHKHPGAEPSRAALARLIARAGDAIAADAQDFLNTCATAVGTMLDETLS